MLHWWNILLILVYIIMNTEHQIQYPTMMNSLIQRRAVNNAIRQHAMTYPSLDRDLPHSRENYMKNINEPVLELEDQSPDPAFIHHSNNFSANPTQQNDGTIILFPGIATTVTASKFNAFPPMPLPSSSASLSTASDSSQKYQHIRESSKNMCLKYCCSLRNFLLGLHLAFF